MAQLSTSLPVLILTDCDVGGLEIFCVYKFGSIHNAYSQANLAVPLSWWVGFLLEDLLELNLPLKSVTKQDMRQHSWTELLGGYLQPQQDK